jgi:hypothetical protein
MPRHEYTAVEIIRLCDYVLGELSGDSMCDPYEMLWSAVFDLMARGRRQPERHPSSKDN